MRRMITVKQAEQIKTNKEAIESLQPQLAEEQPSEVYISISLNSFYNEDGYYEAAVLEGSFTDAELLYLNGNSIACEGEHTFTVQAPSGYDDGYARYYLTAQVSSGSGGYEIISGELANQNILLEPENIKIIIDEEELEYEPSTGSWICPNDVDQEFDVTVVITKESLLSLIPD